MTLADGFSLVVGDRIEYVGTTHDYSIATVVDTAEFSSRSRLVEFECSLGHRHENLYRAGDRVRLVE